MAGETNTQREKKKEAMRSNMLEGQGKTFRYAWHMREYSVLIYRIILPVLAFAALVIFLAILIYNNVRTYSSYQVKWTMEVSNPSSMNYIKFGDGMLMSGKDGISYYDGQGESLWSIPYDMKSPTVIVEGEYALVYDLKGKTAIICDLKGKTGMVVSSCEIIRADISAGGVVVMAQKENQGCTIYYYKNNGEQLDISIRGELLSVGYPLDISISPNSQQLMVSYYTIENDKGFTRIIFYDFEKGKELENRITADFSQEETDTFVPVVVYSENDTAFAVGDNKLLFYSVKDRLNIEEKTIEADGEIQKFFYNDEYLGIAVRDTETKENRIDLYYINGKKAGSFAQEGLFDHYFLKDSQVIMYNEKACKIISLRGRELLSLLFENEIHMITPAKDSSSLYLASANMIQKIVLK